MTDWAEDEFGAASLGDKRLTLRLIKLATRFAQQPTASIPGACGGAAETKAAYRFFDQANEDQRELRWEAILQPHIANKTARMLDASGRLVPSGHDRTRLQWARDRRTGSVVV
jgi:hypothetical protein